jgi:hypothetical protein
MAVVGSLASLLRSRKTTADSTNAADDPDATGEFVAHEAEINAELAESQPFAPATGIAEPLEPAEPRSVKDDATEPRSVKTA